MAASNKKREISCEKSSPTLRSKSSKFLRSNHAGATISTFTKSGSGVFTEALTAAYKAGQNSQYGIPVDCIVSALASILEDMRTFGNDANEAIQKGEQNQAIGALLYLEEMLPAAQALYKAALTLHRLPRKGGAQ